MKLLGRWAEVLEAAQARAERRLLVVRPDLSRAASEVRVVTTTEGAAELAREVRTAALSALAFAFASTGDLRFQKPRAAAVAAWATDGTIFAAVLDLGADGVPAALEAILGARVPLVFHDCKPALFALWALGLDPVVPSLYDTRLAGACLHLGVHHPRRLGCPPEQPASEAVRQREALEAERRGLLSLEGQCAHYGVALPIPPRATGTIPRVEARTLAARAIWVVHVYVAQQQDLVRRGLHGHLYAIEFPFAVANARMEWRGVHVDTTRLERLRAASDRAARHFATKLRSFGVNPPGSPEALRRVVRLNLGPLEDDALRRAEGDHPAIRAFRLHRRYSRLARQRWPVGPDGRVHAEHRQLAAATGRNGCRNPNVVGVGRVLRPVVTAPPGRALVELDYAQIEVGVAAAEHGDRELIAAYNEGDAYATAAQRFYAEELSEADRSMAPLEFRKRHAELREAMKPFVLALLYGGGAETVAAQFGISEAEASRRIERFLGLFPRLSLGLLEDEEYGLARGYASVVTGLRRDVLSSAPEGWTRNWLRNTPVQGGATVVFKKVVIELDRAFLGADCWLVLPIHDAVLIECPANEIDAVAERARAIMEDALRAFYPVLEPRVEVNKAHPECWNKDGHADSLERFLDDPDFSFGGSMRRGCDG